MDIHQPWAAGLVNGSSDTVSNIVWSVGVTDSRKEAPMAVLNYFADYCEPQIEGLDPEVVLVLRIPRKFITRGLFCRRAFFSPYRGIRCRGP